MHDLFGHDEQKPKVASDLLRAYDDAYRRRYHVPAPIVGKKDGPLAARLLKLYTFDDLYNWVALFFLMPDTFIQQSGHTFSVFSACIGKVIAYGNRAQAARVERQPPSQNLLDVRRQMDEEAYLAGQDAAAAYYRKHPWLSR